MSSTTTTTTTDISSAALNVNASTDPVPPIDINAKSGKGTKSTKHNASSRTGHNSDEAYASIVAAARAAISQVTKNNDANVRLTQQVAYQIMLYRDLQIADHVKPVSWPMLHAGGKALTGWLKDMGVIFIGVKPTGLGDTSQHKLDVLELYRNKLAVLTQAAKLCIAMGMQRCTGKNFIEKEGCFVVPGAMLIPTDKPWYGIMGLEEAIKNKAMVPLNNRAYEIKFTHPSDSDLNGHRKVYASVRQILAVYSYKPAVVSPSVTEALATANADTKGASDSDGKLFTAADIRAVMAKRTIPELARAIQKAFKDDKGAAWGTESFSDSEWALLMSVAHQINSIRSHVDMKASDKKAA